MEVGTKNVFITILVAVIVIQIEYIPMVTITVKDTFGNPVSGISVHVSYDKGCFGIIYCRSVYSVPLRQWRRTKDDGVVRYWPRLRFATPKTEYLKLLINKGLQIKTQFQIKNRTLITKGSQEKVQFQIKDRTPFWNNKIIDRTNAAYLSFEKTIELEPWKRGVVMRIPFTLVPVSTLTKNGQDSCNALPGMRFRSVGKHEVGLGLNGPELGYWDVSFQNGHVSWNYSDVQESGTYACKEGYIEASMGGGRTVQGEYDHNEETLRWHGGRYRKIVE